MVLESEPLPGPVKSAPTGTVKVVGSTSDTLTLEIETPQPAILLVTDLYSRDWHVRSLDASMQAKYEIMPANYVLRAVPLAAGHHRILMEFVPTAFSLGLSISAAAWLGWLGAVLILVRRGRGEFAGKNSVAAAAVVANASQ